MSPFGIALVVLHETGGFGGSTIGWDVVEQPGTDHLAHTATTGYISTCSLAATAAAASLSIPIPMQRSSPECKEFIDRSKSIVSLINIIYDVDLLSATS